MRGEFLLHQKKRQRWDELLQRVGRSISGEAVTRDDGHSPVTAFAAQVAEVSVDPATGEVTLRKLTTAHDTGAIMNPVGHQGQIDGGVVQGVGYGLIEYLPVQDGRVEVAQLRRIQNSQHPRYSAAQNRHRRERQRRRAVQSQRHRRKSDLAGGAGHRQRHRRRGRRAHTRFADHGGEGVCSAGTRPKCVSGFKSRAKLAFAVAWSLNTLIRFLMIRLLQLISWRHVRHHRLRTLLTFLGMALGVAVIIAIALVNRALTTSFQSTIEQIAGKAVLQVSNSESGMAEAVLPLVRDTEGVLDVAAAVDGFLPVSGARAERLYIYGVDLLTDFTMRDHKFAGDGFAFEQSLDFIAQPDSIAVTESFARRLGLSIGSTLALNTSRGKQNFMVRALLRETGTARVFGGNFALMDLPVAQLAFGKEGKLDIVDLTVEAGATVETVQEKLRQRLRGAADVERPKKRGEQIESLLTSFRVGLFFVSLIALFVGFFLSTTRCRCRWCNANARSARCAVSACAAPNCSA